MIRVFLICLACCCSSLMPLKQSESIVSEDHTQVVERKSKHNYYRELQYSVQYSLNVLCSDVYWINMNNFIVNNPSSILLGGNTNVSCYDFYNNNVGWTASSSSLSSLYIYRDNNGTIEQLNQNNVYFTSVVFEHYNAGSTGSRYYVKYNISFNNNNIYCEIYAYYNSANNFIGCAFVPSSNFYDYIGDSYIFSFPKGNFVLSENAESTLTYDEGYTDGYQAGYDFGYDNRQAEVDTQVYDEGYTAGHQAGYAEGIAYSQEQSSTALTIFTGILEVGLLPVNVFLQMFNYEVFGINIAGFISGLITIAMVMIFVRFIFGGKDNGK